MEMAGLSVRVLKEHDEKRAAADNGREREGHPVTILYRDVEENINENLRCTSDEQDATNAIEIELVQDVANEISHGCLTSADSITTVSSDASYFVEIYEHELEKDGFGVYGLGTQEADLFEDLNPFCVALESMGKLACCLADTVLDDKSIDSFPIMAPEVGFPEDSYMPDDEPSGRLFFMNKNDCLNRNDDHVICHENGGNNKRIVISNDGNPSSHENGDGSPNRKEDNSVDNVGGSETNTSIKEKASTTDNECLVPDAAIHERLNSDLDGMKEMPSESKDGPEKSFKKTERVSKTESGKINLQAWSNEREADTKAAVAVEVEIDDVVNRKAVLVAAARKFLKNRMNKAKHERGEGASKKVPKETKMASNISIAGRVTIGEGVGIGDVGEPKIVKPTRKFELWKHLTEKSKDKPHNGSGESGHDTLSNESAAAAIEMFPATVGKNLDSGNAMLGMMQMLHNALLPKKEGASYKQSFLFADAKKDARPDMSEQSTSTEGASQTDDEPETSKLADVVLADDLSLSIESVVHLNEGGGDANVSTHEKVPSTRYEWYECLLPGAANLEQLNSDLDETKALPSECKVGPERSFKKTTRVAKTKSFDDGLKKMSNDTQVDTETLVSVEVEIGESLEPKAVPVAAARKLGLNESLESRMDKAKHDTAQTSLKTVYKESEMASKILIAAQVAIGDRVERGDVGEPKIVESKRKLKLWKRLKEKNKNKVDDKSGKYGFETDSNKSASAFEMLIAEEGGNGESENAELGMMQMLEKALLPKKEGASYKPSFLFADAKKDARQDTSELSKSTEVATETDDEPNTSTVADVVLADDLSPSFESVVRLNDGGRDTNVSIQETLPTTRYEWYECLLPGAAIHGRQNSDLGTPKAVLSESKDELEKSFEKKMRVAKAESYNVDLEMRSNETQVDTETLIAVEVEIADLLEPKAVPVASARELGLKKSLKNRKVEAKSERLNFFLGFWNPVPLECNFGTEKSYKKTTKVAKTQCGKVDLDKGSNETHVDTETLLAAEVEKGEDVEPKPIPVASTRKFGLKKSKNKAKSERDKTGIEKAAKETEMTATEDSVEDCDLGEPKVVESKGKSELWICPKKMTHKSKRKSGTISVKKSSKETTIASKTKLATQNANTPNESQRSFERVIVKSEPLRVQECNGSWSAAFLDLIRKLENVLLPEPASASHHPSHVDMLPVLNAPVSVGKQRDVSPDMSVWAVSADDVCKTDDKADAFKLANVVLANDSSPILEKPVWKATVDPSTGLLYFYHRYTRVTTWTAPPGFIKQ